MPQHPHRSSPPCWNDPDATQRIPVVRNGPEQASWTPIPASQTPQRRRAIWKGVGIATGTLCVLLLIAAWIDPGSSSNSLDRSGGSGAESGAVIGSSPLGCEIVTMFDPRATAVFPSECTSVQLGKLFCAARDPVAFLGTGGDFRGTGMRGQTVDNFIDADGSRFQWVVSAAGDPVTVTMYLLCNGNGRTLPITQEEMTTLIRVGDQLPPTLSAKLSEGDAASLAAVEPPPSAPAQTAVDGQSPQSLPGGAHPTTA